MPRTIRVARCSQTDIEQMRTFFFALEEKIDTVDEYELGKWITDNYTDGCGRHWQRLVFGYETLLENACDPSLSYLDWKPEIKTLWPANAASAAAAAQANNPTPPALPPAAPSGTNATNGSST